MYELIEIKNGDEILVEFSNDLYRLIHKANNTTGFTGKIRCDNSALGINGILAEYKNGLCLFMSQFAL